MLKIWGPVIIAALLYLPSLGGSFQHDDFPWIHAPVIQGRFPAVPGRPVQTICLQGVYRVGGLSATPYRAFSLVFHVALVAILANRAKSAVFPLLFAVHPVLVSTVAYVIQSSVILCAFFGIAAFDCYKRGRYGFAIIALILAAGSKQVGFMFPVVILAHWLIIRRRVAPSIIIALALVAFLWYTLSHDMFACFTYREFSPWSRLCTQAKLIFTVYLPMIFVPHIDHYAFDHSAIMPIRHCGWLVGLGLALIVVAYTTSRRVFFLLVAVLILMIPEFTVLNLELVYEHRLYIPLAFLVYGLSGVSVKPVVALAVPWLIAVNMHYQHIFSTPTRLWSHALACYPESYRATLNLAKLRAFVDKQQATQLFNRLETLRDPSRGLWRKDYLVWVKTFKPLMDSQK